jgi:pyridoxal phosphate enzyme (YggS family)
MESIMSDPAVKVRSVLSRIRQAEQRFQRPPGSVGLLAVSKKHPPAAIAAVAATGQRHFGENFLQEALGKIRALDHLDLDWHFIGPIQSNKTRGIAEHFNWVESVDRLKVAQRLSAQRPEDLPPLNLCLQVNVSGESSKSGARSQELDGLARAVANLPRLRLRGLMAIPANTEDFAAQRRSFAQLRKLQEQLIAAGLDLDTLSMGMSSDLEAAIAEGATQVRIGTAIFGPRS